MKLSISAKNAKVYLSWSKVEADYFRVFCKIDGIFVEYTKVFDTNFVTLSLLPYGENACFVQAIKNGIIIDKTSVKNFILDAIDTVAFKTDENQVQIHYSAYPNAKAYRLYTDNGDKNFGGKLNSEQTNLTTRFEENVSYKIKPYALDNKQARLILNSSPIFDCQKNEFLSLSVHKSFNNKMFITWLFEGVADGFLVYSQGAEFPIFETNDRLRHYAYLENFSVDTKFCVKAYVNSPNGKIVISTSDFVVCSNIEFGEPKISLIIPAYNAKDYIARSIDTALSSTFHDFEIVIVNDGSTDSTQDIIDWYVQNYDNVVSLQKLNGGVADTRNVGIKAAKGEYIAFMDNDDMIRPNMLEELYKTITKNDCDVAIAPLYRLVDSGYTVHCKLPFPTDIAIDIDKYLDIMYTPNFYNCAIWNKLYRASIVKAHPLGILRYEDVSWTPCILSYAKTFCFLDTPFYEWDRKLRPETFGDYLAKMPENELFEHRKQAMLFFVEKGNQSKIAYLKEIAKRRLLRYDGNSNHSGYKELIERIETDEYLD